MRPDRDLLGLRFMERRSLSQGWPWVVGSRASWGEDTQPLHKAFARDIRGRKQPGLPTSEMLLGAGSKTGGEYRFHSLYGERRLLEPLL